MKSITILGTLGKDPVIRTTQTGKNLVNFPLAVDDGWGERKKTIWFDCTVWGARGEVIIDHASKGDKLCVTGELSMREYEGKTYLTVNVGAFSFAGKKQSGERRQGGAPAGGDVAGELEDSIPF